MPPVTPRAEIALEIPFHDLDPMGVVWHGHYVRYFELARCALLEKAGYNYQHMVRDGFTWPVTGFEVQYRRALVFRQRVIVSVAATEWHHRLCLAYAIRDEASGIMACKGKSTQVAVGTGSGELVFPCPPRMVAAFARLAQGNGPEPADPVAATAANSRPWPRWTPDA